MQLGICPAIFPVKRKKEAPPLYEKGASRQRNEMKLVIVIRRESEQPVAVASDNHRTKG
jgi:hypothetical protein